MLKLNLFGTPKIVLDGKAVAINRRKSRAILYYIAAHQLPISREHLLAMFWNTPDRPAALQTLRTILHGLRKLLGDSILVADEAVQLSPNAEVDVRQFETGLSHTHPSPDAIAAALNLYGGEFLQDVSLADSPEVENWLTIERERYRKLAVRGHAALAKYLQARHQYTAALDSLDKALALDPLQEDIQRDAIRLYYLAGDRAGAIRRYDTLRKLLDTEMGVPPMAETRAVYDAILADSLSDDSVAPATAFVPASAQKAVTPTLPFVGRTAELAQLHAAQDRRQFVFIEGEPGAGKTRLADEFMAGRQSIVLKGSARELEQSLPYQPLVEALRALPRRPDWNTLRPSALRTLAPVWQSELSRILPELGAGLSASTPADESRLWESINQLLLALAQHQPVTVFIDDLHWADSSTVGLLGYLARQHATAPITLLGAARAVSPRSPSGVLLQTLTRELRLHTIQLHRLSTGDINALAVQLSASPTSALTEWLERHSEGNPYILVELVRYARQQNILREGEPFTALQTDGPVLPPSVYTLIQSRLSRLSHAARRLLDAAVAVGRKFDFNLAARASDLDEATALDAVDELRASGLVYPSADDRVGRIFEFDHSLTMEVAYRDVGELRHRQLHRRIAESLEAAHPVGARDEVAGLLASHFAEGNLSERAAPYALMAAQSAAALAAWKEATAFYTLALAHETDPARRADIQTERGRALLHTGDNATASENVSAALQYALAQNDPPQITRTAELLAQTYLAQSRFADVIELAQTIKRHAPGYGEAVAELLWGTALSLEGADLSAAAEHLEACAELLRAAGADHLRTAHVLFELGSVCAQRGELHNAVSLYRESLALVAEDESPDGVTQRILALNNLAFHLHLLGDSSAHDFAQSGLMLAKEGGMLGLQAFLYSTLGEIALAADDLDTAEKLFVTGLELANTLSQSERIAGLTANLGLLAARRAQTATAIHRLSTALARADSLGTQHLAAQIRLWLVPLLPPAEARARLAEARAIALSSNRQRLLAEADALEQRFLAP